MQSLPAAISNKEKTLHRFTKARGIEIRPNSLSEDRRDFNAALQKFS